MRGYRRALAFAIAICTVASATLPAYAQEFSWQSQSILESRDSGSPTVFENAGHTKEEIKARAKELGNPGKKFKGNVFIEEPTYKISTNYVAGKASASSLNDGLNMLNMIRYVAGLSDNVTLNDEYVTLAQHGAVLLACTGRLSHYPKQPENMPDEFYEMGVAGTRSSNLAEGGWMAASIVDYMRDYGPNNYLSLGHRRWILSPTMRETGFGATSRGFNFTYVMDRNDVKTPDIDYDFISWPAAGAQPLEFFNIDYGWSVHLNPNVFNDDKDLLMQNVKVQLTRQRDGKKWTFDKNDYPNTYNEKGKYFNVSKSGYGGASVGSVIIFKPTNSSVGTFRNNDEFTVEITGLQNKDGEDATIRYTTNLFNLYSGSSNGGGSSGGSSSGGSSGGGSSSGGSSKGSSSSSSTSNVNTAVEYERRLDEIIPSVLPQNGVVSFNTKGNDYLSAATLKAAAEKLGSKGQLVINSEAADRKLGYENVDLSAQGQSKRAVLQYVFPVSQMAANTTDKLQLSLRSDISATRNLFQKYYTNEFAVIGLRQQGSFGTTVRIGAWVDLSKLNTNSLCFYSYDVASNTISRIEKPNYKLANEGYLYFSTPLAGDILITDKPMTLK